jgi:hypothetical protein
MVRTLAAFAAAAAALALAGAAGAAVAPSTPDLHPLASPRAAGATTISWSPSTFPAGTTGRWYELAVDSFYGPGESLSDHHVYTAAWPATSKTIVTQPGRRYWVRARAAAQFGVWSIVSGVDEMGFRTDWRPIADPPPDPPIETLAAATHATSPYPTTPVFDPLPATVVPDAAGSVTVGWTSTFLWGSSYFNPRFVLRIETDPLPPYAETTETRTLAVPPPIIRNYVGPFTSHQTWRVSARLPGSTTVRVQAAESVKPSGELSSAWAARAFEVEPVLTQG